MSNNTLVNKTRKGVLQQMQEGYEDKDTLRLRIDAPAISSALKFGTILTIFASLHSGYLIKQRSRKCIGLATAVLVVVLSLSLDWYIHP
jgi:hypothetical protein